jgi:23S rRNA pseudouridine1911/1915/1917 synthase
MCIDVLYEDNHLLAVSKPANLPTMGVPEGKPSLLVAAKQYIKQKYAKPGNVYLGVVSRLDAPVTGVVLFARTSKAASRLAQLFRRGEVTKRYWAIVERVPQPEAGTCVDWLRHDERHRRVAVCGERGDKARKARLNYRLLQRLRRGALLEIELITGRKHQIRVQLAHRGWPVAGDRKYGGRLSFDPGIALHSRTLRFCHPVRKSAVDLVAPIPGSWRELGITPDETGS